MKLLLVASKYRGAAAELLRANGEKCEIIPGGLEVEYPALCREILDQHKIISIIDE